MKQTLHALRLGLYITIFGCLILEGIKTNFLTPVGIFTTVFLFTGSIVDQFRQIK